jgi:hypothetical protein
VNVLRVVLFREGPYWLAQGLERDVGAQAGNLRDLIARFELVLGMEDGLDSLPPAPKYFQDLWPRRAGGFVPSQSPAPTIARIAWGMVA